MTDSVSPFLTAWSGFYTMVGSAAAALTGLMFVVITLITGATRFDASHDGLAAFSTPTVVHFSCALLVSALLLAPWHTLVNASIVVGLLGLYGIVHIVQVVLRTRRLSSYQADVEDWVWYSGLPLLAYGLIFIGALGLVFDPALSLFSVASGVVLLIFIGIRNSWDVVTFIALEQAATNREAQPADDRVAQESVIDAGVAPIVVVPEPTQSEATP